MVQFVKLKAPDGRSVLVNVGQVKYVLSQSGGSLLYFKSGGFVDVDETPGELALLLNDAGVEA